jgi:hypothetical protein
VIEQLSKGKSRLNALEECVKELQNILPPKEIEERRELWQKLEDIGILSPRPSKDGNGLKPS